MMKSVPGLHPGPTTEQQRERMKKMSENKEQSRIQELFDEVEFYRQAVQDVGDALESAEMELDEALAAVFDNENG